MLGLWWRLIISSTSFFIHSSSFILSAISRIHGLGYWLPHDGGIHPEVLLTIRGLTLAVSEVTTEEKEPIPSVCFR